MSLELAIARQITDDVIEKTDAVFGRMLVCADPATGRRVAEHLADDGHRVLWSHRITPERVFLDQTETVIATG